MKKAPIILIAGPTATGKTAFSVQLAKALEIDIISADSQLVYKELNIGTAKPTLEEQNGVIHHGLDLVDPTVQYTAGQYADDLLPVLEKYLAENKPVIITGGTGFYIQSLLQPERVQKIPPNLNLRQKLEEMAHEKPDTWLHEQLQQKDPNRASKVHPKDNRRVIRALEIIEALGEAVPETPTEFKYPVYPIGLAYEHKENYHQAINKRIDAMLAAGFLDEAVSIYKQYGDCPALKSALGYRNLIDVHENKCTLEEAKTAIQLMTRQYSKRQITWFQKVPNIEWYAVDSTDMDALVAKIILDQLL